MRYSFLSIFLLLSLTHVQCAGKQDSLRITGQVLNSTSNQITVVLRELTGRENYTYNLDTEGRFEFVLKSGSAHDNYLMYENTMLDFFASPTDVIYFEADTRDFRGTASFSGDNENLNNALVLRHKFFLQAIYSSKLRKNKFAGKEKLFYQSLLTFREIMLAKTDSISNGLNLKESESDYLKAFIDYKMGREILEYYKIHSDSTVLGYEFFSQCETPKASDLMVSQFYESFVNAYTYLYFYKLRLQDEYTSFLKRLNGNEKHQAYVDIYGVIDRNVPNPVLKEAMLVQSFSQLTTQDVRTAEALYKDVQGYFKPGMQALIERKLSDQLDYLSKDITIEDLSEMDYIGEVFAEIKDDYPSQALYVNLWGTWCKPCIEQIPDLNSLTAEFESKPVKFINLCVQSNSDSWQEAIDRYNLGGEHYLLTAEQFRVFSEVFRISAVPQYFIFDKDGALVSKNAKRPSDRLLKQELLDISNVE